MKMTTHTLLPESHAGFGRQTQLPMTFPFGVSKKLLLALWTIVFTALLNDGTAQDCTMVCNDVVSFSLGNSCLAEVTYDMILEDPDNPAVCFPVGPGAYQVILKDNGLVLPTSPFIDATSIGKVLGVTVKHLASGNSCWGFIVVEDKVPPAITCPPDLTVSCTQATDPAITGTPDVSDCSDFTLSFFDLKENLGCSSSPVLALITRTWTAVDVFNNISTCTQLISIRKSSVNDVVFPLNLDDVQSPSLSCENPNTDPSNTGEPTLDGSPLLLTGFCNIIATFSDQELPSCGNSLTLLRTWTLADWCAGIILKQVQIIKAEDKEGPQLSCPSDLTVGMNASEQCSALVILPEVGITDNCSTNFTVTMNTPAGLVTGNGGPVPGISQGTVPITYNVTDECGNTSSCQMNLTVVDDITPTMICDGFTTISLNADGTVAVPAIVFDDGSFDNCCFDHFEVRRMLAGCDQTQTNFGPTVTLCCEDIGTDVTVQLKGVDCSGNSNNCMVIAHVQDKFAPTILCPADLTLDCTQDFTDLNLTGQPETNDGCHVAEVNFTDQIDLTTCGVGQVIRTWTTADDFGNSNSCSQTITLQDNTPVSVAFPPDFELTGCATVASLDPDSLSAPFNFPVVSGDDCELVARNYEDVVFQVSPPACFKIVRTWTLIDWCSYQANSNNTTGFFQDQQILSVFDNEAPTFACPNDFTVEITGNQCFTSVTLPNVTVSDCSDETFVVVNSDFGTGFGPFDNVVAGTYNATYSAFDGCGNSTSCAITITVIDGKKPTPFCLSGLVIELMGIDTTGDGIPDDGMVEIWASDFDAGSTDNCPGELSLSFSSDVNEISKTFNCLNLGVNSIQLWVTDASGNQDFCETTLVIQDNMGICHPATPEPLVAGSVNNEMGNDVESVSVSVNDGVTSPVITGPDGKFAFPSLEPGNDYTLSPEKDINPLNGISTWDMVLIHRHIVDYERLQSPYKIIAADVNNSGSITTMDLIEMQKMILQEQTEFSNNTSWRFVDAAYEFQNPDNPFAESFPEFFNVNNLRNDMLNINFIGIKIGDVNDSAIPNNLLSAEDRDAEDELSFQVEDRELQPGQTFQIDFKAKDFFEIMGFQFTINFDQSAMEFTGFEKGELDQLSEANFGFSNLNRGMLTSSWSHFDPQNLHEDAVLFSLRFKAKTNTRLSNMLHLNSALTKAEAYRKDGVRLRVGLTFDGENGIPSIAEDAFELRQNYPNPFHSATIVSFSLPEAQDITFKVFDVSGSILFLKQGSFAKGQHEIQIQATDLPTQGMLYYQLETATDSATKKMVFIP